MYFMWRQRLVRTGVEYLVAVGGNREPLAGLAFCELDVVQLHGVLQAAYRQAEIVGVVDTEAHHELLFQQACLDHFHLQQLDVGVFEAAGHPAAAREIGENSPRHY